MATTAQHLTLIAAAFTAFVAGGARAASQPAFGGVLRYCGGKDLYLVASLEGDKGQEVGGISLRNRSVHSCRLGRAPRVRIVWRRFLLPLRQTLFRSYQANANQHPVTVLGPRRWAFVPLWWSNWCGPYRWGKSAFRPRLELRLRSAGRFLSADLHHPSLLVAPRCDWPRRGSTVRVGPFYSPLPDGWTP